MKAENDAPPAINGLVYLESLGSGGYSDVHHEQQMPRRKVAVKVLKKVDLTDTIRRQFTAEANAMAALADHPTIVPVFAADIAADGRPYIVMMYYPRPNLALRASDERFSVADVLRLGIQISSAAETAHRAGILHRDIKPANVLTSQYGAPGLTDFGIASQMASLEEDEDTGVSVPWSPPEVLYGTASASVQSDVYSVGATLWHLLVGRSPFEIVGGDNSTYALMRRVRDNPVPEIDREDVPMSLDRLLRQAMLEVQVGVRSPRSRSDGRCRRSSRSNDFRAPRSSSSTTTSRSPSEAVRRSTAIRPGSARGRWFSRQLPHRVLARRTSRDMPNRLPSSQCETCTRRRHHRVEIAMSSRRRFVALSPSW